MKLVKLFTEQRLQHKFIFLKTAVSSNSAGIFFHLVFICVVFAAQAIVNKMK
jgi:hypothetical protein